MLILMSDLHLAESQSNQLGDRRFSHNLPAMVYRSYFNEIGSIIQENSIPYVDLVLAGDIFEITRSSLWLKDDLRPYVNNAEVFENSLLEARIMEVMGEITADERVAETLKIIRSLEEDFQVPVRLHYLPGNHDRLINATPKIRRQAKTALGLSINDSPFANQYIHYVQGLARILVRHGHEYDRSNFAENLETWERIPLFIDKSLYAEPVLGDIVTLEVAQKLPHLFKEYYSADTILALEQLLVLYQRLIDFDNVRPAEALMNFLFSTPGLSQRQVWEFIEPVFIKALDEIAKNAAVSEKILKLGNLAGITATWLDMLMDTRLWRHGIPFWVIEKVLDALSGRTKIASSLYLIKNEECLQPGKSTIDCIVSGHTHNPLVELVKVYGGKQKYALNTGTFRNVITTTPELDQFGRLRSRARILIFEKGETNPEYTRETGWSFDFTAKYGYGTEPEFG